MQVKAELDKLADPSPAFAQLLMMENNPDDQGEQMEDSEFFLSKQKRTPLGTLFGKIERAKPAVHPKTIDLARKL